MNRRKNRYVHICISLFVALILQTTLMKELTVFGVSPALVFVLAVCFSLVNDCIPSGIFAAVAGLLLDVCGSRAIGLNSLMMLYLSLGIVMVGREFFQDSPRSAMVIVIVGTIIYETLYFILNYLIFGSPYFWHIMWRVIGVEAVYNGILAIPVYLYVNKFLKISGGRSLLD